MVYFNCSISENVRGLLSVPLKHVPHRKRKGKLKPREEKGGTLKFILDYLNKCGFIKIFVYFIKNLFVFH